LRRWRRSRSWTRRCRRNRDAARRAIFESIEIIHNRNRLHGTLGYLTPAEYEEPRQKSAEVV
jgi:transposase InsO family protein